MDVCYRAGSIASSPTLTTWGRPWTRTSSTCCSTPPQSTDPSSSWRLQTRLRLMLRYKYTTQQSYRLVILLNMIISECPLENQLLQSTDSRYIYVWRVYKSYFSSDFDKGYQKQVLQMNFTNKSKQKKRCPFGLQPHR